MCAMICCENEFPSLDILRNTELTDQDGAGIAWINGNKVEWLKGLKAQELYDFIQSREIKTPCVIHFRKANTGSKSLKLCHPFAINDQKENELRGKADSVLFHSGHISEYNKYMKMIEKTTKDRFDKQWSDSRLMAYMTYHYGLSFLKILLDMSKHSQKVAILTPNGITKLGNGWITHDNMSHSNVDFEYPNTFHYGVFSDIHYKEYPILTKYQRELSERRGSMKEGMSQLFDDDQELSLNHISAKKAIDIDKDLDDNAQTRYNFYGL
jgi:hypothetical protein